MSIEYVALPGETAPPVPEGPKLCNGADMRVIHDAFIWGYEQAPGLIRSAAPGDTARSEYVGQWLADLDATLHVHHEGEDQMVWDKLEQRSPSCALHVGQMRAHHAKVAELLDEASPLLARWRAGADAAVGERLVDAYERMLDVLRVHLRREVVEMVPVFEKVLTEEEWEAVAEHAVGVIPKSRLLPQLGMLLANASPDDRVQFFATLPRPVRLLWRATGRRQYAKQFKTLFPGRPVPETI